MAQSMLNICETSASGRQGAWLCASPPKQSTPPCRYGGLCRFAGQPERNERCGDLYCADRSRAEMGQCIPIEAARRRLRSYRPFVIARKKRIGISRTRLQSSKRSVPLMSNNGWLWRAISVLVLVRYILAWNDEEKRLQLEGRGE